MRTQTRELFERYLERQAELNGVDVRTVREGKAFAIEPSIQQKLITRQQESSEFLSRIGIVSVVEQSGETLGLGVSAPLARRTNTANADRPTQDPTSFSSVEYQVKQTDSDTHLTYAKLDAWAKFEDFQARISNLITQRQALDRIMIGFNGVSAAAQTDPVAFPMLQDVNVGWLQHIRVNAPARVMSEGEKEAGKIIIDPAANVGDYRNLDALVYDARQQLLPSWARGDTNLVAICGDGLLHQKYLPMVDREEKPTELQALDIILSKKQLGGSAAALVPFVPAGTILLTRFDNLAIYEQEGKRRRTVVDNARRNRVETFESSNDAYVIENYDYVALIENVQFGLTPEEPEAP